MRWLVLLLALLAFASITAWGDEGAVETDRPRARPLASPGDAPSFHFLVFADRTGGPPEGLDVLRRAVREANLLAPDFVMTIGDLVPGYTNAEPWLEQMHAFRAIMAELDMPWYPVAGNHDIYWRGGPAPTGHHEGSFEQHFGPLWYSFEHKGCAFIVLYTDEGDPATNTKGWTAAELNRFSDRQIAWLRSTLSRTRALKSTFVFLHHPRWIAHEYPGSDWARVHELLVEAGNVRAVFAGHLHRRRYDGRRDGIEYHTVAATGGRLPFEAPGSGFLQSVTQVTVRPDGVRTATLPVGAVLDPRAMTPERLEAIDRLRFLEAEPDTSALVFDGTGMGEGQYAVTLPNPTSRPIEVTLQVEARDEAWAFSPGRFEDRIEPGASRRFEFTYRRDASQTLDAFALPDLLLSVDYLAEDGPVRLPARRLGVAWAMTGVGRDVFASTTQGALSLDGSGACLLVESVRLDVPDGPFTVEAWVRSPDYGGYRAVLGKADKSEYGLYVSDGMPSFDLYLAEGRVRVAADAPLLVGGRWHHVAGVYDGTSVALYVDGELLGTRPARGARLRNAWPLYVGADPDAGGEPTGAFRGWIDEVRVSRVARYDVARFTPLRRLEPDDDTLLLLHLDRALGPFAPDHAPGARHARCRGDVGYGMPDGER